MNSYELSLTVLNTLLILFPTGTFKKIIVACANFSLLHVIKFAVVFKDYIRKWKDYI